MKKLLLIVSVLALGVCANAQLLKKSVSFRQLVKAPTAIDYSKVAAPARTAVSAITPADGQFWWGYFTESDAASLPYSNGYLGLGQASTISTGIGVKGHHPFVEGGKVVAVRFWLGDDISKINSDVTIWISSSLPDDISSASYTQTLPRTSLQNRLNEIALTTPYVINNADFYIGYSFSISDRSYPIMGGGTDKENGWFYQYSGYEDWIDFYGEEYGNLAFQILIDGVALPENSATPSDFGTSYALMGGSIVVPVKIFNGGKNSISSISYTINGGSEQTVSIARLGFNEEADVDIVLPADAEPRRYAKRLTITKVNGQPNEASDPSADGNLITVIEKPVATPVVEEFTGMWCGWCPVGWDGLEKTKESFGDQVILIAVHGGDELQCSDYDPILYAVPSFPSSHVDRIHDAYPSASVLNYYVGQQLDRVTVGTISAKAQWSSEARTSISVTTDTKFVYNDDSGDYGVALVVLADGLTDASWVQSNFLSEDPNYKFIPFWYNAGSKVTGLEYNHVPVAAWNIVNGFDGSISPVISAGETQRFAYDADISGNTLIQDKSKLSVVALLIDRSSGIIVNAAQVAIDEPGEDVGEDVFTSLTVEGITMTFKVISEEDKTCQVGADENAIDRSTTGPVTIPETANGYKVIAISEDAFYSCKGLTSVTIPAGVTTLGEEIFEGCDNLASVTFAGAVTSIGAEAFKRTALTSLILPEGLVSIGEEAFFRCEKLTSVTIPSTVTSIDDEAFFGCNSLTEVISLIQDPFAINESVFYISTDGKYATGFTSATLYVPTGTKAKYEATEGWNKFQNIVEISPDGIACPSVEVTQQGRAVVYSLSGQRQSQLQRGVNIIDGKKVVVK